MFSKTCAFLRFLDLRETETQDIFFRYVQGISQHPFPSLARNHKITFWLLQNVERVTRYSSILADYNSTRRNWYAHS